MTCKNCIHINVCKFANEDVSIGTKVKEIIHNCKDFQDKEDIITINKAAELSSKIYDYPCDDYIKEYGEYFACVCNYTDICNCPSIECWKQYFKHYKNM